MKKNRILKIVLTLVALATLVGCSSNKAGVVSYQNLEGLTVCAINEDSSLDCGDASTFSQAITALGSPNDSTGYDQGTGTGTLVWNYTIEEKDFSLVLTFENTYLTSKPVSADVGLFLNVYSTPIGFRVTGINGAWDWVIKQIAIFTYHASNLFGLLGNTYLYWLGLLLMTLVIRTAAWPVYAKSNDMSLKMSIAQPELQKIQEKYSGRTDQVSQQRMQMETMELYKKYKINLFGCLMPILQMPIFIAMYQVVQRFPLTDASVYGGISGIMNTSFLWTDLGNKAMLANLPLAVIVAGTMWLSQWLSSKRAKAAQKVPNRYQNQQAAQTQKTMQFMMYFMVIMMGYIALGNAGIAFYWIIGNAYQLFQSEVSHRQSQARKDKIMAKM